MVAGFKVYNQQKDTWCRAPVDGCFWRSCKSKNTDLVEGLHCFVNNFVDSEIHLQCAVSSVYFQ